MNFKVVILLLISVLCNFNKIASNNLDLNFPQFAGSNFYVTVFQGQRNDTIRSGILPANGKITVDIPPLYSANKGICVICIKNINIETVLQNEDYSVNCTDSVITINNISFEKSHENDTLYHFLKKQNELYSRIEAHFSARRVAAGNQLLMYSLNNEYPALEKAYSDLQNELRESPTYAGFYLRLSNFLRGMGSKIYSSAEQKTLFAEELKNYVTQEVDILNLYTSGRWNYIISLTFNMFPNEKDFGENWVKILQRTENNVAFERLGNDLMMICEQFGWDEAREIMIDYIEKSQRISNPAGYIRVALLLNKTKPGTKAPKISGVKSLANTILIFYESGCDHCNEQLDLLTAKYDQLQQQGIQVISLSTDTDEKVFKYHSAKYPWEIKLCDYKGFKGENFLKYGVFGTPTLYYIGENEIITDRKAKLDQITELKLE
ncbi:MAG: thioredoxin family protein [Dysgonamonadaceae bacterium]|jgi:hypothetical protein|nr:thioredoxin family protein [Dysgonamonadaceae bacterium]